MADVIVGVVEGVGVIVVVGVVVVVEMVVVVLMVVVVVVVGFAVFAAMVVVLTGNLFCHCMYHLYLFFIKYMGNKSLQFSATGPRT